MSSTDVNWHGIIGAGLIDACCMAAAIRVIGNPVSLFEQHSDERAADAYGGEQGTRGDWGRRPSRARSPTGAGSGRA